MSLSPLQIVTMAPPCCWRGCAASGWSWSTTPSRATGRGSTEPPLPAPPFPPEVHKHTLTQHTWRHRTIHIYTHIHTRVHPNMCSSADLTGSGCPVTWEHLHTKTFLCFHHITDRPQLDRRVVCCLSAAPTALSILSPRAVTLRWSSRGQQWSLHQCGLSLPLAASRFLVWRTESLVKSCLWILKDGDWTEKKKICTGQRNRDELRGSAGACDVAASPQGGTAGDFAFKVKSNCNS